MKRKRLILVATDKGGVGKSTFSIHVADYLKEKGEKFIAFDPDSANNSFARFFTENGKPEKWMRFINIMEDTSLDQITKALEEETDIVLVDGIASQQKAFLNWIEEIDLFNRRKELSLDITFVLVVDEDVDTVEQVLTTVKRAEENVEYLVVKNLKNAETSEIYDSSQARKMINLFSPIEIVFPKLKGPLVTIIQSKSLTLSKASKDERVYKNDQMRFGNYKKRIWGELDKAKDLLVPKKDE